MSDHDKEILHQAKNVKGYDYAALLTLIDLAESKECKSEIETIMLRLYRKEEARGGMG